MNSLTETAGYCQGPGGSVGANVGVMMACECSVEKLS